MTELPVLSGHTVMSSFTSYILGTTFGLPHDMSYFKKVDIKFGDFKINWVIVLANGEMQGEFLITSDEDGVAQMMISRMYEGDNLQEDSIGMTQYDQTPYHTECVLNLIKELPKLDFYEMCVGCITNKCGDHQDTDNLH